MRSGAIDHRSVLAQTSHAYNHVNSAGQAAGRGGRMLNLGSPKNHTSGSGASATSAEAALVGATRWCSSGAWRSERQSSPWRSDSASSDVVAGAPPGGPGCCWCCGPSPLLPARDRGQTTYSGLRRGRAAVHP